MARTIHFASLSGGIDSLAATLVAIERAAKRSMDLRLFNADLGGNENPITHEYIGYLEQALGMPILRKRADFTEALAQRRAHIDHHWSKEKRTKKHTAECKARRETMLKSAGRDWKAWRSKCDCPVRISPPVEPELIERAKAMLHPTGEPFLDLCLLKGRFPSRMAQFCTEELKLAPFNAVVHPLLEAGHNVVSWIGERADESEARAKKPPIQRIRWPRSGGDLVLYRPIHKWKKAECFALAKRHGVLPNKLYQMGMGRVGCFCINSSKQEIAQTAKRFPEVIERITEWQRLVGMVSRHQSATFFSGTESDPLAGDIHRMVDWAQTTRGGRQYDLLQALSRAQAEQEWAMCESAYGLCE